MRVSCSSALCLQLDMEQHDSRAPRGTQAGQHHQGMWNGSSALQGSLNTHSTHIPRCAAPIAHSTLYKKGDRVRYATVLKYEETSRELRACNNNKPHSPLNLKWPKTAQWLQWKCQFCFNFFNSRLNLPNDCLLPVAVFQERVSLRKGLSVTQVCAKLLTLQSSIAEPCSFRWHSWLDNDWRCRDLLNWCSTLDKFPNNAILNLQSFPCCFCSQTSILRVHHRSCVVGLPWCPESPLSNSL